MSIPINPVFPVIDATAVASDVQLQPGTVINARVVKLLNDNLVRIAIASLSINVLSEVELEVGSILKLAVSQTPDGIRLAIVSPANGAASSAATSLPLAPAIAQATDVSAILANRPVVELVPPILSPVEALAVTAAAQVAAAKQTGLSPLFANVSVAAASGNLPEPLQQAAQQLLAIRPELTTGLSGDDIKLAFQKSGLFLESSLASGAVLQTDVPDLKAALIVFRETLSTWLGEVAPENPAEPVPGQAAASSAANPKTSAAPNALALPAPDFDVEEIYLPKALLPVAEEFSLSSGSGEIFSSSARSLSAGARAASVTAALNILQNIVRSTSSKIIEANATIVDGKATATPPALEANAGVPRTGAPPPPFRGADPSPQSVSSPSIIPDAAPAELARQLVDDADGAIARQTLMQIASLPDRADMPGMRIDSATARWNFEIPFATPRGTAVAQFEISRDGGGGKTVAAANRVWRARFSLNVEPAGPVHAIVSLIGDTTSVRMWAERPETATQLQSNATQLGHALRRAELEPGDIVIGNGTPPQTSAPAGHFLDHAT